MALLLLAIFIAVPLVEIAIFIQVGDAIGLWPTLALVIGTAIVGSWQLRVQGFAALSRARRQMDQGQLPTKELFDGFCLLLAGLLLLTPGLLTDSLGALLFLSPVRAFLRHYLSQRMAGHVDLRGGGFAGRGARPPGQGDPRSHSGYTAGQNPKQGPGRGGRPSGAAGPTIDGDFQEIDDDPAPGKRDTPSPWQKAVPEKTTVEKTTADEVTADDATTDKAAPRDGPDRKPGAKNR
jgi:UPF0716 protein FxsA|tara:strand:+ start:1490 stop:2197 length:708 start_codon:yes stop_codon:yes gene_type:complete